MRQTWEEGKREGDEEKAIGLHRFKFHAPHRVTVVFGGVFTVEEAEEMVRLILDAGDRFGPLFLGVDATEFGVSGSRVRSVFANANGRKYPARAAAVWGANYTVRTAMNMVIRASLYLKKDLVTFPIEFLRDESEALAWFASLET